MPSVTESIQQSDDRQAAEAVRLQASVSALPGPDGEGVSLLHVAAARGLGETVNALLAQGADINARSKCGSTPLIEACKADQEGTAMLLMEAGADHSQQDGQGQSALHWTTQNKNSVLSTALLRSGASPNLQDTFNRTPLMWACHRGMVEWVKRAVEKHAADLTLASQGGDSVLHWACKGESSSCVTYLCTLANVDATLANNAGDKAADVCKDAGAKICVERRVEQQMKETGSQEKTYEVPEDGGVGPLGVFAAGTRGGATKAPKKKMTIKLRK